MLPLRDRLPTRTFPFVNYLFIAANVAIHLWKTALLESGYYRRRETVEQTLKGLGFSSAELDRPATTFSGGWQMRVALGRCLLENPHLLLLDEPTNYLDLEAKDWLEGFLRASACGFLLVSHDRGFLDAVVGDGDQHHRVRRDQWNGVGVERGISDRRLHRHAGRRWRRGDR